MSVGVQASGSIQQFKAACANSTAHMSGLVWAEGLAEWAPLADCNALKLAVSDWN